MLFIDRRFHIAQSKAMVAKFAQRIVIFMEITVSGIIRSRERRALAVAKTTTVC